MKTQDMNNVDLVKYVIILLLISVPLFSSANYSTYARKFSVQLYIKKSYYSQIFQAVIVLPIAFSIYCVASGFNLSIKI